jgi:Amt family ammonium transporter
LYAGSAALVTLLFVGNRYASETNLATPRSTGHSVVMSALGVFFIWSGWYGFNVISLQASRGRLALSVRSTITHSLASCAAACTQLIIQATFGHFRVWTKYEADFYGFMNSVIGGSVAIAAGCHVIDPGYSMFIGIVAAFLVFFASKLFRDVFHLDDTVDAVVTHGLCGMLGLWMTGFLSTKDNVFLAYGPSINFEPGHQFGIQILGSLVICAWGAGSTAVILLLVSRFIKLRVSADDDASGNDFKYFESYAYPDFEQMVRIARERINTENAMRRRIQKQKFEEGASPKFQPSADPPKSNTKEPKSISKEKDKEGKETSREREKSKEKSNNKSRSKDLLV